MTCWFFRMVYPSAPPVSLWKSAALAPSTTTTASSLAAVEVDPA